MNHEKGHLCVDHGPQPHQRAVFEPGGLIDIVRPDR
jgi:hypothetical protein